MRTTRRKFYFRWLQSTLVLVRSHSILQSPSATSSKIARVSSAMIAANLPSTVFVTMAQSLMTSTTIRTISTIWMMIWEDSTMKVSTEAMRTMTRLRATMARVMESCTVLHMMTTTWRTRTTWYPLVLKEPTALIAVASMQSSTTPSLCTLRVVTRVAPTLASTLEMACVMTPVVLSTVSWALIARIAVPWALITSLALMMTGGGMMMMTTGLSMMEIF
mmetsp:Transcript_26871/g.53792  ORF Transcript_26871/g.53792 Transcript_26871/m.53792 type:complete len:219 (-) Transcript_26871:413-1069(-)